MAKILIVDDEARILLLLQSLLKANGYETVAAKDGHDALDAIKTSAFALVITDLRMAPMDGMTLFKEIKVLRPGMPVIQRVGPTAATVLINGESGTGKFFRTNRHKILPPEAGSSRQKGQGVCATDELVFRFCKNVCHF
jgi:DNA-binding NtrC family response regulator